MKRRDFLKTASVAGAATLFDYAMPLPAHAFDTGGGTGIAEGLYYLDAGREKNLMPAVRKEILDNPRAVFIIETHLDARADDNGWFTEGRPQLVEIGRDIARKLFVPGTQAGGGTVILPNFTSLQDETLSPVVGVNTSCDFIAGFIESMRELGNTNMLLTERGGNIRNRYDG